MKTFMGQEVTTKETDAKDIHRVSKSSSHKIFEDLGITKDIRRACEEAQEKVIQEGLTACAEEAKKTKKRQELIIGTGNNAITVGIKDKQVSIDPTTKKSIVKYAVPFARVGFKLNKKTKDLFAETNAALAKTFKS